MNQPYRDIAKAEGWKELAELIGILRGGAAENSIPSVELKNLSGGAVQKTVKIYNPDPDKAKEDAIRIWEELTALYG